METEKAVEKTGTSTGGMTAKVFKGSFWVLMGQVLPLMATFVATPFVIRQLGSESYGVLILAGLISSYFLFADFGMGLTSTKFGSEAYAENNFEKEGAIVRVAFVIAFLSSLVIILPLFFFSGWVVGDIMKVPPHLQDVASIALKIASISFLLSLLSSVVNTPQLSRLRMDLNVLINAGTKILMTLITPVILYLGGGVIEATIVGFVAAAVCLSAHIFVSGRLLPSFLKLSIDKSLIEPLLKFGGSVVLFGIGLTVINYMERFILARVVSVKSLAYYSVASTFAFMATSFSLAMVQTLLPAFSQLVGGKKVKELNLLFSRTIRVSFIGLVPIILILLIIARHFFTLWAGEEFGQASIYPFYILLIGIIFGVVAYIPNCILMAAGKTKLFARLYIFEIIPYALLGYVLIHFFGIVGAAIAYSTREIVNAFISIRLVKRNTGITHSVWENGSRYLLSVIPFLPAVIAALFFNASLLLLAILLPIGVVGYLWFAWTLLIDQTERDWVKIKFPFLFSSTQRGIKG